MANQAYARWLHEVVAPFFASGEFRIALIDTDVYTPNLTDAGHEFVSNITNGGILSEETLTGVQWVNRVFDAEDFSNNFPDHGGGATGEALTIYKHEPVSFAVAGGNQGGKTVFIATDQTANFSPGKKVVWSGSTGNNGDYNVDSVSFNAGTSQTEVVFKEDIPSATMDGNIETSDEAASRLMFWMDSVTGLPMIKDGNDDSIVFNANGIWRLNV